MDALLERLDAAQIDEVLNPTRPSCLRRRRFGLF
jgi:hypothetical protein